MEEKKKESLRARIERVTLRYRLTRGRGGVIIAGLLMTLVLTSVCIPEPSLFQYFDRKMYDFLMAKVPRQVPTQVPAIVEIDEKSLAAYGQWPWPRYRIARLLEAIREDGAMGVGIDTLFAEPDRTSPANLARQLLEEFSVDAKFMGIPPELMDHDRMLARVLAAGPFVLGFYFDFASRLDCSKPLDFMKPISLSVRQDPGGKGPEESLMTSGEAVIPLDVLSKAARWKGFLNIVNDPDGYVRSAPLLLACKGQIYPSLPLAALMQSQGMEKLGLRLSSGGVEALDVGGVTVPLDPGGRLLLKFRGKSRTFPYYSAVDVLKGRIPKQTFQGKIVFVGTAAAGLQDLHDTSMEPEFPGVELHATVVDNILRGDFVHIPGWTSKLEICLCLTVGFLSTLLVVLTSGVWIAIINIFFAAAVWSSSWLWLCLAGVYFSPLSSLIILFGNSALLVPVKFWREERQKHFLQRAFSRYVAPSIVDQILKSPDRLSLVGEEREVSILFADIRGFTTLSEPLSPTQVSTLLHAYFTPMARIITGNLGTVDKFIGDAIMAFWNAPLDIENHREMAALSALEMIRKLEVLNDTVMKDLGVTIRTGIGLHCGRVRVGNMGSEDLFHYTIIGDNVNVASRVEGLTKRYGVPILLTESIAAYCRDEFVCQEIDTVRVKGREEPVRVYTIHHKDCAKTLAHELDTYNEALEHFKAGRFEKAMGIFSALAKAFPEKIVYRIYAGRSAGLLKKNLRSGREPAWPPKSA
ncbi:MAG: adenylate/guanylate cyclase domain-containing protein [Syntrophobacteraceae bacterium]|nr:adenylate/guanylate cyclase domain-containing protein [Desulfobacteraceae bacterium]